MKHKNQIEQPFFFENNGNNIFAILHSPEGRSLNKAFVFCYPFGFEADTCRRIYAAFARKLASMGFYVLRFNYMGTGDSEGSFERATVQTHISDIVRAIDVLKKRYMVQKIELLGMKLGATWAVLTTANTNVSLESLVLWDPVINVKKFFDDSFRQVITFQSVLFQKVLFDRKQIIDKLLSGECSDYQGYRLNSIDGFEISPEFYRQAINIDLTEHLMRYPGNILIIQIDRGNMSIKDELLNLQKICKSENKKIYLLQAKEPIPWWTPEGEIRVSEPEQIFDITEDWIRNNIMN